MCKWVVNQCDCPVSYCTEGLEQLGSLEVEYYFSVPEKDAIPILETVCKAVESGLVIEDGVMYKDLFKNVAVFFFKTKSLASDKEVFRLVLPDWELEFPWEIYGGISQKAHFKRQIKFDSDKAFCLTISAESVNDEEIKAEFIKQGDLYVLPFLYYVLEYDRSFVVAPWFDKFSAYDYYKGKINEIKGISDFKIVCIDLSVNNPLFNDFKNWKEEYERCKK